MQQWYKHLLRHNTAWGWPSYPLMCVCLCSKHTYTLTIYLFKGALCHFYFYGPVNKQRHRALDARNYFLHQKRQYVVYVNVYVSFSINGAFTDVHVTHDAMGTNIPPYHH